MGLQREEQIGHNHVVVGANKRKERELKQIKHTKQQAMAHHQEHIPSPKEQFH
jgi:hypothetical protein